jgi:hypothetical protein
MAATRRVNPLLKADFPARAPKRHGQGLPRCAPGFPSYDMGARPHMSYKLARSAKKANNRTGSVQPPCGYTSFHLRRNQRLRRQTAAQGACNRPAVIRPSIFTATSGQGGEPPHKERVTALRLFALPSSPQPAVKEANRRTRSVQPPCGCAPLGFDRWSNLWHGGLGPHDMHPARRFLSAEKSHRRSRQYRASSRPSQKAEKINFQNQCSDSRHPVHGPTKALSAEVTGQSATGTGVVVGVTMGGPAIIASTDAQEQRANRQSNFDPTCRLASSPEAGPGATVGTLNQGYPLLQYEVAVPVRRSLAIR